MYMGRIVEYGDRNSILSNPVHPYTQNLLTSVPIPNPVLEVLNPPVLKKSDEVLSRVELKERSVFLKFGFTTENFPLI